MTFDGQAGVGGTGASGGSSSSSNGSSSTSSSGSSTSSTSSTSSSSGGGGPPCGESPCKLTLPQCGCDPGFKCTIDSDERICGPVDSQPKQVGEQCTADHECAAGSICWTMGGAISLCHEFCDGNGDCSPPGGQCLIEFVNQNQTVTGQACTMNCDLVSSAGCIPSTAKCAALWAGSSWATLCVGAGTGTQGTPCNDTSDCASGLGCLNTGQAMFCLTWCMVANPTCPTGQCHQLNPGLLVGSVEYGACL